jgi:hypothetical protein
MATGVIPETPMKHQNILSSQESTAVGRLRSGGLWACRARSAALIALLLLGLCGDVGRGGVMMNGLTPKKIDPKPWIEARSFFTFPLASGDALNSPAALSNSLAGGLALAFTPPAGGAVHVDTRGTTLDKLALLEINLTNCAQRMGGAPVKVKRERIPIPLAQAAKFAVTASPLMMGGGAVFYDLTADAAKLDLRPDKHGKPLMVMDDATGGTMTIDTTIPALQAAALASVRADAAEDGIKIDGLQLSLSSDNPHSIGMKVAVAAHQGIIYTTVHFAATMDVDDQMNATGHDIHLSGDGPVGGLLMALVAPFVKSSEGRTAPLVDFSDPGLKLSDLNISVNGQAVHIAAKFVKATTPAAK